MIDVQPLVALQANEICAKHIRQHFGDLSFADASFAFEQERALQLEREINGGDESALSDVVARRERGLEIVYGAKHTH